MSKKDKKLLQSLYNDVQQANFETYAREPNNDFWVNATKLMGSLLKKIKDKYDLGPDPIEKRWLERPED